MVVVDDGELYSISQVSRAFGLSVPTLRFYEEQGLVECTRRVGRVRHYDRAALHALAYALLWHRDGGLSLDDTRALMATERNEARRALIERQLTRVEERMEWLRDVRATLEHLWECGSDDPRSCPVTGAALRAAVDEAFADDAGGRSDAR